MILTSSRNLHNKKYFLFQKLQFSQKKSSESSECFSVLLKHSLDSLDFFFQKNICPINKIHFFNLRMWKMMKLLLVSLSESSESSECFSVSQYVTVKNIQWYKWNQGQERGALQNHFSNIIMEGPITYLLLWGENLR